MTSSSTNEIETSQQATARPAVGGNDKHALVLLVAGGIHDPESAAVEQPVPENPVADADAAKGPRANENADSQFSKYGRQPEQR